MTYLIMGLIAIGLVVVGIPALIITIAYWYVMIPLIGIFAGGWLGFFFGVGVVVVIATLLEIFAPVPSKK